MRLTKIDAVKLAVELAKAVCVSGEKVVWATDDVSEFIKEISKSIAEASDSAD